MRHPVHFILSTFCVCMVLPLINFASNDRFYKQKYVAAKEIRVPNWQDPEGGDCIAGSGV